MTGEKRLFALVSDNKVAAPGRGGIGNFDSDGGGGDDGGMEERLRKIEDRLLTMEAKADNFATKEDIRMLEGAIRSSESTLKSTINDQTWKLITWVSAVAVAIVGATFFIARHST